MNEALQWEKGPDGNVRCHLCSHRCLIKPGRQGICRVRQNFVGELYTLVYGRTISRNVDPIEKKPLYHVCPGSRSYSVAAPGCNFRCRWCQNWEISQIPRERGLIMGREASPAEIVEGARATGCRSIAYTYTEPTVYFEYTLDAARLAHDAGLLNVYVTNGYMTAETLEAIHPYLDAANVDLKAFREKPYRKYVGARLQPVLDSLKRMKRLGVWVEVTTLLIPGINDDPVEFGDVARFISRDLDVNTPWHISRFFPCYQMADVVPTPVETLRRAREIGLAEGLHYVYVGNVVDGQGHDTLCPGCGHTLIARSNLDVLANRVRKGRCPKCGTGIPGILRACPDFGRTAGPFPRRGQRRPEDRGATSTHL